MLSLVGKKFYVFWATILLIFPLIINLLWLNAVNSSSDNQDAIAIFIGYFPLLFQFRTFLAFLNLFLSTLSFMFSLRLLRSRDKYIAYGLILLVLSSYLMISNIWNLI